MFEIFMITFREGLEAFLVVAIAITYLSKTGGEKLIPSVRHASMVAVVSCAILGIILARIGAITPFWEGTLALLAAIFVVSCTTHMIKMGKHMKREITGLIDRAVQNPSGSAKLAVFTFVLLMIGREGLEAATMIASLAADTDSRNLAIGGVIGLIIAALVAWAWSKYGHRINLSLFFRVTSAFMVIFSVQLVIYAFHEYTESAEIAKLGLLDTAYWHHTTEAWGPQGKIGAWITYSLVLVPLAFLVVGFLKGKDAAPMMPSKS